MCNLFSELAFFFLDLFLKGRRGQARRSVHVKLEGNSQVVVFFFHHVAPRDQTHAARLGSSTSLYQLSHFAGPF